MSEISIETKITDRFLEKLKEKKPDISLKELSQIKKIIEENEIDFDKLLEVLPYDSKTDH